MGSTRKLTQKDLRKIRQELSVELGHMSASQRREYFEAAKDVYKGLEKMVRIAEMAGS